MVPSWKIFIFPMWLAKNQTSIASWPMSAPITGMRTQPPATRSAALPEVAALFKQGVTDEVLCVLDTLVYGCAGGSQPACKGSSGSADGG